MGDIGAFPRGYKIIRPWAGQLHASHGCISKSPSAVRKQRKRRGQPPRPDLWNRIIVKANRPRFNKREIEGALLNIWIVGRYNGPGAHIGA